MDIEEIIDKAIERTVTRLMSDGVIKTDRRSVAQKTIDLLERYEGFKLSDKPYTRKVVAQIDSALSMIRSDTYYQIIPMYYFEHLTIFEISETFHPGNCRPAGLQQLLRIFFAIQTAQKNIPRSIPQQVLYRGIKLSAQ